MALIVGTIKRIEALKQITETFKSQEVVLETEEQFSQTVSVQFQQDKTDLLTNFQPGQKVKVEYYLKGKEVIKEGKPPMVFNTLSGWKIEKVV
jgi:hypothetical protein